MSPCACRYIGGNTQCEVGHSIRKECRLKTMLVFEPVKRFIPSLSLSFHGTSGVHVFDYGLGSGAKYITASVQGKSTSAVGDDPGCKGACTTLHIRDIVETMQKLRPLHEGSHDAILYNNCEGCEIEVLERLLDTGLATHFKYTHFATHALDMPGQAQALCGLRWRLMHTHAMQYGAYFAQERWARMAHAHHLELPVKL